MKLKIMAISLFLIAVGCTRESAQDGATDTTGGTGYNATGTTTDQNDTAADGSAMGTGTTGSASDTSDTTSGTAGTSGTTGTTGDTDTGTGTTDANGDAGTMGSDTGTTGASGTDGSATTTDCSSEDRAAGRC